MLFSVENSARPMMRPQRETLALTLLPEQPIHLHAQNAASLPKPQSDLE